TLLPNLARDIDDHRKLGPLLLLGQHVALLGGGEAALGREAKLFERSVFRGLVQPALYVIPLLQRATLGCDEADNRPLLALGQEAQRLQPAGAVGVVLQEIAV